MYFARRFLRLTSCLSFYLSLYFMCYLLYRGPFASYMENGTKRRGSVTRFDRSRSTRSGHRIGQQHQRRRRQGRRRPLHRMSHSSQSFVPQTAVDPQRKPEKKIFFFSFVLFYLSSSSYPTQSFRYFPQTLAISSTQQLVLNIIISRMLALSSFPAFLFWAWLAFYSLSFRQQFAGRHFQYFFAILFFIGRQRLN